jgi:hypothetical protein
MFVFEADPPGASLGTIEEPVQSQPMDAAEAEDRAAAEARASAQALARPAVDVARAAAGAPPDRPPGGSVYGSSSVDDEPSDGLAGRLDRVTAGWHTASRSALRLLGLPALGSGLLLGMDGERRPASVRVFGPAATRLTLIGGVWAAQVILLRALALGASAMILTSDPAPWRRLGETATGEADRVVVLPPEQRVVAFATAAQPALIIHDLGTTGPASHLALGAWQAELILLRQLDQPGVPFVRDSDLVLAQRLSPAEARLAASTQRLTRGQADRLQSLGDDMVALIGDGSDRHVWVAATQIEQELFGAARR